MPAQRLGKQEPGVAQQQGRSAGKIFRQFPGPRQQLVRRQDLGDKAELERLLRVERLPGQRK